MATHSSILIWKIPSTEEYHYQSTVPWGLKESDTTKRLLSFFLICKRPLSLQSTQILSLRSVTINKIAGLPWWLSGKESACQCRRCGFDLWVGKIPWRRK